MEQVRIASLALDHPASDLKSEVSFRRHCGWWPAPVFRNCCHNKLFQTKEPASPCRVRESEHRARGGSQRLGWADQSRLRAGERVDTAEPMI